ncbi:hypothetical protein ACMFMG_002837 [Clarireedia jacksonii]
MSQISNTVDESAMSMERVNNEIEEIEREISQRTDTIDSILGSGNSRGPSSIPQAQEIMRRKAKIEEILNLAEEVNSRASVILDFTRTRINELKEEWEKLAQS